MTTASSSIPVKPSDVACIDLVNSTFSDHVGSGEWSDRVGDRTWQRWFLDWHDLGSPPPGTPPVDDLVALRSDVRRVLEKWSSHQRLNTRDARALNRWICDVPMQRRVATSDQGLELREEPVRRGWASVLAAVAASAVELIASGDHRRMKVCANPACSWAFYDQTINGSRQYCSTTPCASLLRVRRFRRGR